MGTMDPDGTLYIRGRSKTMILSGNGQNIYPEEIEDKLNNMYMVLESLVLDAGNGRLRALVVPDYEQADAEGVVFIVRNSVPVKITLFSNFGSTNGLMSFSVPHRALPYSASRRNFLAFLLLK